MNPENTRIFAPIVDPEAMSKAIENYKARKGEDGYDPALVATMEAELVRAIRSASWPQPFALGMDHGVGPIRCTSVLVSVDGGAK